ncbi:MAG: hypothetical protein CME26_00335 [Gemmatimonadetes bacterium]|nr:hypothetical protein [Gemmatimonadota bacterium]|tara:strand:- start:14407 stop:14742 length:336 start_codon:yes stop_codon:yes gene_type:complete
MPISILHCADTHLGVETYGRTDPATGLNTRLQDFSNSLRFTFQTAIDEGFDTQDSEGVDRLVDAIEVIRGDFQKILVISHVEAIKDAFPVTIAVTKTADRGSTFGILGSAE